MPGGGSDPLYAPTTGGSEPELYTIRPTTSSWTPLHVLLIYSAPATPALHCSHDTHTSGPLHLLVSQSKTLFPQILTWLTLASFRSRLNGTVLRRLFLTHLLNLLSIHHLIPPPCFLSPVACTDTLRILLIDHICCLSPPLKCTHPKGRDFPLLCSWLHPQVLGWHLAHSRCSINSSFLTCQALF